MAKNKTNNKQKKQKKDVVKINKQKKQKQPLNFNNPFLIALGILVIILIISYFTLGLIITAIMAFGIGCILLLSYLFKKTKGHKVKRRILNIFIIFILTIGIVGCIGAGCFFAYVVKQAPKFNVKNLDSKEASIFYDKDNQVFAKVGAQMREKVTYDELPQVLIDALIATEDSRFFQHNGFDAPRFLIASIKQVAGQSNAGGASTISMQVIKNSFTSSEDEGMEGIIRKFTDIYLAVFKLEKNYTKEQIIEFYVNNHFLGGKGLNVYGVEEASRTYFGKSVKELNLSEAAILAGMFKSPSSYRPDIYPEYAEDRRGTVLYLMEKHGYITNEERKMAASIPITSLTVPIVEQSDAYQGYINTVCLELKKKYKVDPYTTPLLVYTNLDRSKQDGINKIFNGETFAWVDDVVQSGVAVVETHSGKVVAIGDGRNKGVKGYNLAVEMKRQPGSSAKPLFDFGPGIEFNKWSTYTLFNDEPYQYSTGESIKNWDGKYFGTLTLRQALALSRNIPALKAFQQVDNSKIISFVQGVGIQPNVVNGKIYESHSLGAFDGVSPLQMSAAYAAFSNGGYYYEPYSVNKIVYRDTNETKEYSSEKKKAMSDYTAYMITSVLQDVITNGSTIQNVAQKTGTTNYDDKTMELHNLPYDAIRDSWIVGYNTDYSLGMWYGYEETDSEYCSRNIPATIQRDKLYRALAKVIFTNNKPFTMPNSVVKVGIEKGTNPALLASSSTRESEIVYEYFIKGTEPTETSVKYEKLSNVSNLKASYDENKKTVKITWDKLPVKEANISYGPFGYFVYHNNKLLGFTENNHYTISNEKDPEGTYKVVTSYQNYTDNQSSGATYKLDLDEGITYSASFKDGVKTTVSLKVGDTYTPPLGKEIIDVFAKGEKDTENISNKATFNKPIIYDFDNNEVEKIDTSTPGVYTIKYKVSYKDFSKTLTLTITIIN